ncbi:hypothetical protein [Brochothrix campestris]|uniref:Uncharacterized protein n=1 Tax=Brochothrix campestris FSL F6-1037 TaxID=1265861 RepID=W7CUN3_9LIST|nr:hypothetical protein [Brochothrix campestris]EUJ39561.1 hypothetical protein BCAMP_07050 [Brochothrix campestris FSL F6-1037]
MKFLKYIVMVIIFIVGVICFKQLDYPFSAEDMSQNYHIAVYVIKNVYIILGIVLGYLMLFNRK